MNYTWEVRSFKHSWPSAYGQGADLALGRIGVAALRLSSAVEAKKKHGRTPRSELERARETERDRERSVFACLSICRVGAAGAGRRGMDSRSGNAQAMELDAFRALWFGALQGAPNTLCSHVQQFWSASTLKKRVWSSARHWNLFELSQHIRAP